MKKEGGNGGVKEKRVALGVLFFHPLWEMYVCVCLFATTRFFFMPTPRPQPT